MPSKRRKVLMLLESGPYITEIRPRQEVKALLEAGYKVSVVSPRHKKSRFFEVIDGASVYSFPILTHTGSALSYFIEYGYGLTAIFILSLLVWFREGVDIVHAHNPPDFLFPVAAFLKLFGKKFVFDHRDLAPELYLMRFPQKSNNLVYKLLLLAERNSCSLADCILATNVSYRDIEITRHGVQASKVFIVRNGPDSQTRLVECDPELRQRASTIIGYVGVMGPQDGVEYLLRALHHLAVDLNQPDFYCVLIGQGHTVENLQALAKSLNLEKQVWFTGWVERKELLKLLSTADICIQPDPSGPLNNVSTMTKTMEYMVLGKPVVAFDLQETRYTGGDLILYARPNDEHDLARQIARLMQDGDLRRQLGEQGRQRIISGYTWEHSVVNLLQAYQTLDN